MEVAKLELVKYLEIWFELYIWIYICVWLSLATEPRNVAPTTLIHLIHEHIKTIALFSNSHKAIAYAVMQAKVVVDNQG